MAPQEKRDGTTHRHRTNANRRSTLPTCHLGVSGRLWSVGLPETLSPDTLFCRNLLQHLREKWWSVAANEAVIALVHARSARPFPAGSGSAQLCRNVHDARNPTMPPSPVTGYHMGENSRSSSGALRKLLKKTWNCLRSMRGRRAAEATWDIGGAPDILSGPLIAMGGARPCGRDSAQITLVENTYS